MPDREIKERIVKMRYGMEIGYGQEIVRCKDCFHAEHCEIYAGWDGQHLDWFCADGKRKEGDEVG